MPVDLWSLPAELADEIRSVDAVYKTKRREIEERQQRQAAQRRRR